MFFYYVISQELNGKISLGPQKKKKEKKKEIDMPLCKQCILFTLLTPWIMEGIRFLPLGY